MEIQNQVIGAAKDLRSSYPDLPFLFTGHSLGAALSVLSAVDVYLTLGDSRGVMDSFNFGNPRVGNTAFANFVDGIFDSSYRVVNQDDIVPHLPPRIIQDFRHITTEVWFPNATMTYYEICTIGDGEDSYCADSVPFDHFSLEDHLLYMGYNKHIGEAHGCT